MVTASKLSEQGANSRSRRKPPYRPAMTLAPAERESLAAKLGGEQQEEIREFFAEETERATTALG